MREALQGPGALGTTGLFPGAGSPVVLDLGAVSQVIYMEEGVHVAILCCTTRRPAFVTTRNASAEVGERAHFDEITRWRHGFAHNQRLVHPFEK